MLEYHVISPKGKAEFMIVALHGFGSNGEDLMSLQPFFNFGGNIVFLGPNAPIPCQMYDSFSWFSLDDRRNEALLAGLAEASLQLSDFLDAKLKEHELDASKLILLGFSQGTMLSLFYALTQKQSPLAVVGFSGYLAGDLEHWKKALAGRRVKTKFFMSHGDCDDVIPLRNFQNSVEILGKLPLSLQTHVSKNVFHSIDSGALQAAQKFVRDVTAE